MPGLQTFGAHEIDQIADTARVSPLVVVPGDHLNEISAHDQRHGRVHDRRAGIAPEVHRDKFILLVAEVALQRPDSDAFFSAALTSSLVVFFSQ